jgi:hypothetical protein
VSVLTLQQARDYLNTPSTVSTTDAELQTFIDAAEAAIAKRCGPLVSTATTASHVYGGSSSLVLPCTPAISLTSITSATGDVINVSDVQVSKAGVIEYPSGGWFPARWYVVVYQAGRTTVPADLLNGVKEVLSDMFDSQRGASVRPGLAPEMPSKPFLFSYKVEALIAPHVQPGFA